MQNPLGLGIQSLWRGDAYQLQVTATSLAMQTAVVKYPQTSHLYRPEILEVHNAYDMGK